MEGARKANPSSGMPARTYHAVVYGLDPLAPEGKSVENGEPRWAVTAMSSGRRIVLAGPCLQRGLFGLLPLASKSSSGSNPALSESFQRDSTPS
jgi:hypothetical protein